MKRLLKIKELEEYIGMHRNQVYRLVEERKIPYINISRGDKPIYRFDIKQIDKWIDERLQPMAL